MKYLYYTIYRHLLKVKTNDTPAWSAMFLITLLQFTNLATIELLMPKSLRIIYDTRNKVILGAVSITIVLLVINYLFMIKKTEWLTDKYKNETAKQKQMGSIVLFIYSIVSVLAVYFVSNYINAN